MNCSDSVYNPTAPLEQESKSGYLKHQSEFAALCSFIHYFGDDLGVHLTFPQLLEFLTITDGVHRRKWETLHVKLLNKLKYRARPERWEAVLGRFLLLHGGNVDGLADAAAVLQPSVLDVPGTTTVRNDRYYDLDALTRARVLLSLLESQFDRNQSFKEKVNSRSPLELRFQPLGTDVWGQVYWLLKDSEVNILMYREDPERQNIRLICETTDDIRTLCNTLKDVCSEDTKLSSILANHPLKNESKARQSDDPLIFNEKLHPVKPEQSESLTPNCTEAPISPLFTAPSTFDTDQWNQSEPCKLEAHAPNVHNPDAQINGTDKLSSPARDDDIPNYMYTNSGEEKDVTVTNSLELPSMITSNSVHSEPSVVTPHVDSPSVKEISKTKRTKGGWKLEATDIIVNANSAPLEVRRSGRQRKPVEFLTMEPLQPKRSRLVSKIGDLKNAICLDNKVNTPKRKRSRKQHLCIERATDQSKIGVVIKKTGKRRKRKRRRKGVSSRLNPWSVHTSSSETDDGDDAFELALLEQHDCYDESDTEKPQLPLGYCSDWLDKPESDFNPDDVDADSDVDSLIQGRNFARQKRLQQKLTTSTEAPVEVEPDEPCQICLKCDTPEWILLCDRCDLGHHAMCLYPPLFFIPEGDWFCPRCQHSSLVTTLSQCADSLDAEQKKQTIWKRMQERLNYVNISMTNIIAADDDTERDDMKKSHGDRRKRKRSPVAYCESGSSGEYSAESSSFSTPTNSDSEKWFGRRALKSTRSQRRRRSAALGRISQRDRVTFRDDHLPSEPEGTSSEEQLSFAPRATRKREAHYDLSSAFKLLDEALEGDEKYQEERRLRKTRRTNELGGYDEEHEVVGCSDILSEVHGPEAPESSSRGSGFTRIRSKARPRRRAACISSSSSELSGSDSEAKNKASDNDVDFYPSSDSGSTQIAASETEEEFSESSSGKSWLCVSRHTRRVSKRKKPGAKRGSRFQGGLKLRKPIPRFEASASGDSDIERHPRIRSFPQRRTRAVIKYNESEEENSDCSEKIESKPLRFLDNEACEKHNPKTLNDDSDSDHTIQASTRKSSGRGTKRRVLSSDSDYQPSEMEGKNVNGSALMNTGITLSVNESPDHCGGKCSSKPQVHEAVASDHPSELPVPSASQHGHRRQPSTHLIRNASSDEESVEEEAECLLPVRPLVPTTHPLPDVFSSMPQSPDIFDVSDHS